MSTDAPPDEQQDEQGWNRPYRSIWDDDDHEPYDPDEEDDRQSELEKEKEERDREVNKGWFGGDWQDYNDSRWGASRTYDAGPNGLPQAQRPGDQKIKRASYRHTDKFHKGKTKIKRDIHQKPTYKRYVKMRDYKKNKKKKIRHWIFGEPKKVYRR